MTHDPAKAPERRRIAWPHTLCAVAVLGFIGCATLGGDSGQPLVPTRHETKSGPFTVYSNTPLASDSPAIRSLVSLERDLVENLGLRSGATGGASPVEVYILRDRESFSHFLQFYYPELPPRRAFFLAQGPRRVVYTFQNDRLDVDLRHEATHALLHVAVGDLPLWLDEGLAEYFEVPEGRHGLNAEHLARLPDDLKTGWQPDLARLETLKSVRDMSPRDYRESWAWVHYLLNGPSPGKSALLAQLADLKATPQSTVPLSSRLPDARPGLVNPQRLLAHIEKVCNAPPTVASTRQVVDPTVLLQNSTLEPVRVSTRRSVFSRFLSAIGLSARHDDR